MSVCFNSTSVTHLSLKLFSLYTNFKCIARLIFTFWKLWLVFLRISVCLFLFVFYFYFCLCFLRLRVHIFSFFIWANSGLLKSFFQILQILLNSKKYNLLFYFFIIQDIYTIYALLCFWHKYWFEQNEQCLYLVKKNTINYLFLF